MTSVLTCLQVVLRKSLCLGDTTIEDIGGNVINLRDKYIVGRESPNEIIWDTR